MNAVILPVSHSAKDKDILNLSVSEPLKKDPANEMILRVRLDF
jgi:hypothetical protein